MLHFVNNTRYAGVLEAGEGGPSDWEDGRGPMGNFNFTSQPYSVAERRQEISTSCSSATFTLYTRFAPNSENEINYRIPNLRDFSHRMQELNVNGLRRNEFQVLFVTDGPREGGIHANHIIYLAPRRNTSSWMATLPDDRYISELSIPGTHDSVASRHHYNGIVNAAVHCQDMDLDEQLERGVRFLDIRGRHINNTLCIHHGSVYLNFTFTEVLDRCSTFLKANPSETIVMRVKKEHTEEGNTRSYEDTFLDKISNYRHLWYLNNTVPRLGQARGKIVLLRDFDGNSTLGISWPTADDIQDDYDMENVNQKWCRVIDFFSRTARRIRNDELLINFTSAQSWLISPRHMAERHTDFIRGSSTYVNVDGVNTLLAYYLSKNSQLLSCITVMDFPHEILLKLVISKNK